MPWIFSPEFDGHKKQVELDELKTFDALTRAKAFKTRTEAFFLRQVDTFGTSPPWAPFPLAVLTCVGIEMIGAYKYGDAHADRNRHFRRFVEDVDPRFAEVKLAPDGKQRPLSDFLYEGFRNSLAHGFYGRWVFITHRRPEATTFRYSPSKRFVVVNVYWFYQRFKHECETYLRDLASAVDPTTDPLFTFNKTFEKNFALWV